MKHELFLPKPALKFYEGVRVTKDTKVTYETETVKQELKNLVLDTIATEEGSNGFNTYRSKTYVSIDLNEGDILLFDEKKGYYLATNTVSSIDDAIEDISSLKDIPRYTDENSQESE